MRRVLQATWLAGRVYLSLNFGTVLASTVMVGMTPLYPGEKQEKRGDGSLSPRQVLARVQTDLTWPLVYSVVTCKCRGVQGEQHRKAERVPWCTGKLNVLGGV